MAILMTLCCTICVLKRIFKARLWGYVTDGLRRALAWHARGHRFDPGILHHKDLSENSGRSFFYIFDY